MTQTYILVHDLEIRQRCSLVISLSLGHAEHTRFGLVKLVEPVLVSAENLISNGNITRIIRCGEPVEVEVVAGKTLTWHTLQTGRSFVHYKILQYVRPRRVRGFRKLTMYFHQVMK